MDGPKLEDIRPIRVLNIVPPPPPSLLKEIGHSTKSGRKPRQPKPTKAIQNQQNAQLVKVLQQVHIPFLETALQTKHNEIEKLCRILTCRDQSIARRKIISAMKDEEIRTLKNDNIRLTSELQQLRQELTQLTHIEQQMEEIHGERDLCSVLEDETKECALMAAEVAEPINCNQPEHEEHNYARKQPMNPLKYQCEDCGYSTNRKNTLTNHRAETCKMRRRNGLLTEKDKMCKYCFKKMRHNALRAHLRHIINTLKANGQPKGKHSGISLQEYNDYLEQIKLK